MKIFLKKLAWFVTLQALVFAVLFLAARSEVDPYIRTLRAKHRHAATSPGPRLMLVGGSGLAFGIQSDLLKADLPAYTPVNYGLHAGMGLEFILADSLRDVKRGDVVLLCLEFEIWQQFPASNELWDALLCRPATVFGLNKLRLAREGLGFFTYVAGRALKALPGAKRRTDNGLFSDQSFNVYGDITAHRHLPPIRPMIDGDPLSTDPLGCEDESQMPTVKKFVAACEERGARVVIFFPPIPIPLFELHRADVIRYVARQRETFGDRVVGRLEDIPTDEYLFFDGVNHLTWEGGARRTRAIVERLKTTRSLRLDR